MCKIRFAFFCTERCNGRWNWGAKVTAAIDKIPVACVQACVTCVPLSHVYYKHVLHVYKHVSMCDMCTTHTCATSMCYMCMTITCVQACYMCNKHVWNQVCRYFAQSAVDAVDELPEVADAADIQIITEKCV
jgi:hypothetical protein